MSCALTPAHNPHCHIRTQQIKAKSETFRYYCIKAYLALYNHQCLLYKTMIPSVWCMWFFFWLHFFFIVFVTSLWGRGLRPLCLYPIEPSLPLQLLFPMPPLSHASQNSVLLPIQDKIFLSIIKKNIFLLLRISHNAFWLHLSWHLPKLLQDPPQYPPSFPTSDYLTIVRNPFYGLGNRG